MKLRDVARRVTQRSEVSARQKMGHRARTDTRANASRFEACAGSARSARAPAVAVACAA